jgi:hypothetical protein
VPKQLSKNSKSYHHNFIDGFITNNKIPDLPNRKAFPHGVCPINFNKARNIKEIMKYADHSARFLDLFLNEG